MTLKLSRRMLLGGLGSLAGLGLVKSLTGGPGGAPLNLAGHWRSTRIDLEEPVDENLVLAPNGGLETWTVTAGGQSPRVPGRWSADGATITFSFDGAAGAQFPYTFHDGLLVLPDIEGQRSFWERVA